MDRIVGIGDGIISNNIDEVIKTFALASCVAVCAYHPSKNIAGMAHIALPTNRSEDKNSNPYYYADTAVPLLINNMCRRYNLSNNELDIKIFGGANSIRHDDVFNIGRSNIQAVRVALEKLELKCRMAETGGTISRTIEMSVSTGAIKVFTQPINI